MDAAVPFEKFQSPEYFDFDYDDTISMVSYALKKDGKSGGVIPEQAWKRRRFSIIWCGLRGALELEEEKKFAPPQAMSFSGPMTISFLFFLQGYAQKLFKEKEF